METTIAPVMPARTSVTVSANCDLKGIRGDGDWFTCTPETGNSPFADIKLREHVMQHGREAIDKGSQCWLS